MNIDLNNEKLNAALQKVIFDEITGAQKDELVAQAIKHILEPVESGYGYNKTKTSPLIDAFKSAAERVARELANKKLVEDTEFQANLESLFADVGKKLFADEIREKLVSTVCDSIIKGLNQRDY